MGRALIDGSQVAVFTSDNPRSENPEKILAEMTQGLDIHLPNAVVSDRHDAIAYAVSCAQPGDVVVVLGKGHESGQEIAGVITPFDDRLQLAAALEGHR
jgi:UDP-N-acetylmuramoyl-L-alanyl-D-glutamate--2,6-diaminopimelate ligase